jgi:hypothetical protein
VFDGHWSSSTYDGNPANVIGIDFTNGFINSGYTKTLPFYVRAVRAAP